MMRSSQTRAGSYYDKALSRKTNIYYVYREISSTTRDDGIYFLLKIVAHGYRLRMREQIKEDKKRFKDPKILRRGAAKIRKVQHETTRNNASCHHRHCFAPLSTYFRCCGRIALYPMYAYRYSNLGSNWNGEIR